MRRGVGGRLPRHGRGSSRRRSPSINELPGLAETTIGSESIDTRSQMLYSPSNDRCQDDADGEQTAAQDYSGERNAASYR
jgi:hypothetical protein